MMGPTWRLRPLRPLACHRGVTSAVYPLTPAFVFSTYVALYRRYPRSGSASYLPTRAAPLALAHKSYLPTPGLGGGGVIPRIPAEVSPFEV